MPKTPKPVDQVQETEKTTEKVSYYEAVGGRKEASARVRLYVVANDPITISGIAVGRGDVIVNGKPAEVYFRGETYKKAYQEPFRTTNTLTRFAVSVKVYGGGASGQLVAMINGIAKALEKVDHDKFRPILKKRGFLTRDSRIKERRKAGRAGKARAKKQSPKR